MVEVSDTTIRYDYNVRVPLYAVNGIPEVWIANLRDGVLDVYRNPEGGVLQEIIVLRIGEAASPLAFSDVEVEVADILG